MRAHATEPTRPGDHPSCAVGLAIETHPQSATLVFMSTVRMHRSTVDLVLQPAHHHGFTSLACPTAYALMCVALSAMRRHVLAG